MRFLFPLFILAAAPIYLAADLPILAVLCVAFGGWVLNDCLDTE